MKFNLSFRKLAFMLGTAVLITVAGIQFRQSFVRMLPLYLSLLINILQADVNRFAYLLAAFNALLYAWVYYSYGLYASAAYALLISAPLQLFTFINWTRSAYHQGTVFRTLSRKQIAMLTVGYFASFAVLCVVMTALGSSYTIADNIVTVFGILLSLMMLLRFREYAFLMIPNAILRLGLYIIMLEKSPEQLTYVIYTVYLLICSVMTWQNARRLYNDQTVESGK